MNEIEILAGHLYTEYRAAVGMVAYTGAFLPVWSDLRADPGKQKQVYGWLAVARTATTYFQIAPEE